MISYPVETKFTSRRNIMKKFLSFITALLLFILCLTGCNHNSSSEDEKLKVVATIFPQYDFARQIAKDCADIRMLIPPGGESHGFEPTTSDIIAISECDVFIYTGGESDTYIDTILATVKNENMTVISLLDDCVTPYPIGHTFNEGDHSDIDEHIWTSPKNAVVICEKLCEVFAEKDAENAAFYRENLQNLTSELRSLDEEFRDITENAKRNNLVFGDRFPLGYFADAYHLHCYTAFSGCSDDTEASASQVAELVDIIKRDNIPVVFKIELSSGTIADTISKETGAEVMTFYSCHNVSKDDFENGETYLTLMRRNLESLRIALN